MGTTFNWNNTNFTVPAAGELNWSSLSAFLIALGQNAQTTTTQFWNTRVVTTPTDTLAASDAIAICTNTGARTITLPPGSNGRILVVIDGAGNAATNNVTVDGDGSETINGQATYLINDNYGAIILAYNSTAGGWFGLASFVLDTLNNPMTTVGDIIRGGTVLAGVAQPTRLAVGSANTVLTSNGTTPAYALIANANVDGSAAIAVNKLAALTASRAVVSDGSGFVSAATTTATEIGYVNGVTSAIQTQLNAKIGTTLTSAQILVGNGSNVATAVAMSGNVAIDNTGATTIQALAVTNAMLAGSIADSKLDTISTAGKVSGSAITSGTIAGTTIWNTSGAITTTGATTFQNNRIIVGSNNGGTGLTDATIKVLRITGKQYTNANTDFTALGFVSTSSNNSIEIGGGTSSFNAATAIEFYTAANQTTVTGTLRGSIGSTGAWLIGPSAAGPTITATIRGSANNGQLLQLTTPAGHTSGASSVGVLDINTATIVSNVSSSYAFRVQTQIGECFSINNAGLVVIGTGTATTHRLNTVTGTTVGLAGAASALPLTPTGYITININGTDRKIPYYAT
jgi:hypothetical protein